MCKPGWFFPHAGSGSPDYRKASPPAREKEGSPAWQPRLGTLYCVPLHCTEASRPESEPLGPWISTRPQQAGATSSSQLCQPP